MYFDPKQIHPDSGLLIGGQRVRGAASQYPVASPSDPAVVREVSWASEDDVDHAVTSAREALARSGWSTTAPRERARVLRRWADLIDENAHEIACLEALVSARVHGEVTTRDVKVASEVLRFFGEFADKLEGVVTATPEDSLSLTLNEPYGVVGAISPWNFPIILSSWKWAPALAAGNAVVMKPSEFTPFAVTRLAELAAQAGLPEGLLNIVHGDGAVGAALVRHPDVACVTFTGSSATGARIMADAALHGLKPVSLELGGKGAQLVFADAPDLDQLAATVARGITYNSGQACFAGSRLVIEESIAESFIERVRQAMSGLRPGPTWDEGTTLPPVINRKQLDRMSRLVGGGVDAGARLLLGGKQMDGPHGACFFEPTIIQGVPRDNAAFQEEIFGPVLLVDTFREADEGIALANHPHYGLTASVHTLDIRKALHAARRLESGTVWINDWGRRSDMTAPFGGYKRSGIGKDMGAAGYQKYLKSKAVWIQS
ncbi:MAG: aldehyde dehydrogenase [Ectothiorhodospiraceae bacterium]|nr:aldehyde dehydrogenase [Ectothiorhodospiraceae bacterium]